MTEGLVLERILHCSFGVPWISVRIFEDWKMVHSVLFQDDYRKVGMDLFHEISPH